ncbi:hypothetical protein [Ferrovibrio sp.]|uniref:hypothetical protein n=1 Tax=Ferrovibrio sp. TaxID=1917215 RepID=UPI00311EEBFE
MTLATNGKNRTNSGRKRALEKPAPRDGENKMTAAATNSKAASAEPAKKMPTQALDYSDVVNGAQLAAIDDLVGPIDESEYEDIRQRRW